MVMHVVMIVVAVGLRAGKARVRLNADREGECRARSRVIIWHPALLIITITPTAYGIWHC